MTECKQMYIVVVRGKPGDDCPLSHVFIAASQREALRMVRRSSFERKASVYQATMLAQVLAESPRERG